MAKDNLSRFSTNFVDALYFRPFSFSAETKLKRVGKNQKKGENPIKLPISTLLAVLHAKLNVQYRII